MYAPSRTNIVFNNMGTGDHESMQFPVIWEELQAGLYPNRPENTETRFSLLTKNVVIKDNLLFGLTTVMVATAGRPQ